MVRGDRNLSNAISCPGLASPKARPKDSGSVFSQIRGMNQARAIFQNELCTKVSSHQARQRSSVRRSIPRASRKICIRSGSDPVMSRGDQHNHHAPVNPATQKSHRGWSVTFTAPILIATEAMAPFVLTLWLSAAGFAFVFGAVQDAYQAVDKQPPSRRLNSIRLRRIGVEHW